VSEKAQAFQVMIHLRTFAVFQCSGAVPLKNREANVLDFRHLREDRDASSPKCEELYSFFISRTIVKLIFGDYKGFLKKM